MNIEELAAFLNESNKATYANKSAKKVVSARLGSEDYHFEKGKLAYHDTYFGSRDFIGEEIVYEQEKPVWGANYFGFILDSKTREEDVYDFLRTALMQVHNDKIPVRGPKRFIQGNKQYTFVVEGDLSNFSGDEQISFDGKIVYHCKIHGGNII
ncbi:MAG: DUF5680 domain-containing protein [Candidatus Andersenbacteria bacterium]